MNVEAYPFNANSDKLVFQFESVSNHKTIFKEVRYTLISDGEPFIYNLFLGDYNLIDGTISDMTISNNQDMENILATVAQTMIEFLSLRPDCLILFTGSTQSRTRLYRIAISNYLNEFEDFFVVYGRINNEIEPFAANRAYDAFVITLK